MCGKLFSGFFGFLSRSLFLSGRSFFQQSFHRQADSLLLEVDVGDLHLNFLTDGQNVLRLVDALGGNLGNVDQAVNVIETTLAVTTSPIW